MKNLILAIICIFAVSLTASQAANPVTFKKGTIVFNPTLTNIGLNSITMSQKGQSQSMSRFGLQAGGGYAIKDDIMIVGTLGFQSAKSGDNSISLLNISAGAKYYFMPDIYAVGGLVLMSGKMAGKVSSEDDDDEGGSVSKPISSPITSIGLRAGVGYSYFLTKKVALEPSLTYDLGLYTKVMNEEMGLGILSLNLGIIIQL